MEPAFNKLEPTRYGPFLYNVNDRYVGQSYAAYGEWKENEIALFRRFVRDGQVVLDIGANIGQHTLFFAQTVGHQGAVLAFEPQRLFYQTLCANMALNQVVRAYCHHAAVGFASGRLPVPVRVPWLPNFNYSALILHGPEEPDTELVELLCIDDLALRRCDFMKVETVGMEREVLAGAVRTIRDLRPVLYVENDVIGYAAGGGNVLREDNDARSLALIAQLRDLGYDLYWHVAPFFNPANFKRHAVNIFGALASVNMLGLPRERGLSGEGLEPVQPDKPRPSRPSVIG
jgi:FkbM family methyltransferase